MAKHHTCEARLSSLWDDGFSLLTSLTQCREVDRPKSPLLFLPLFYWLWDRGWELAWESSRVGAFIVTLRTLCPPLTPSTSKSNGCGVCGLTSVEWPSIPLVSTLHCRGAGGRERLQPQASGQGDAQRDTGSHGTATGQCRALLDCGGMCQRIMGACAKDRPGNKAIGPAHGRE